MLNTSFISYLKKEINVSPTERLLLQLSFSNTVTQEDIDKLLGEGYEMNEAQFEFNYLLALLRKKHPEIKFPNTIAPRLEGVLRYFHCKNAALLQGFNEVVEQLNQKNIPVLLTKGITMKYFKPDEPRLMYDVDFLVPSEYYQEAVKTAIALGFKGDMEYHSTDLEKNNKSAVIDIHRLFTHGKGKHDSAILAKMFADAEKVFAFGVDVLIPTREDFMLMMMSNAYHNIAVQPPTHQGAYYHFFDCARLIENNKNLNWNTIFDSASKSGILYQVWVYLELLDWLIPSFLPEGLLAKIPMGEKPLDKQIEKDILFRENDKLYNKKKKKLWECKTIGEAALALNVRLEWLLFAVVRKVPVARFLFLNTIFRIETK